jgi:16S rRNA (guanine527-N7)-methyltransferase
VETRELLKEGLCELDIAFSEEQIDAFIVLLSELKKWNRAYNLTGIREDKDIVEKHFLDSLLYLKAMPEGAIKVADIGSGAGFPGIPIKVIRPEIGMYLIEPSGKKAAFLRHVVRKIGLDRIEVIEQRIEEVKSGRELPFPVDIAVTRALFSIREFVKKSSHIVKRGGVMILNKGPKVSEEVNALGDVTCEILTFGLPLSDMKRHIVVVKKQG